MTSRFSDQNPSPEDVTKSGSDCIIFNLIVIDNIIQIYIILNLLIPFKVCVLNRSSAAMIHTGSAEIKAEKYKILVNLIWILGICYSVILMFGIISHGPTESENTDP